MPVLMLRIAIWHDLIPAFVINQLSIPKKGTLSAHLHASVGTHGPHMLANSFTITKLALT